ncbi:hypothetical protein ASG17_13715 [Brevundimonas sp. Leaf363]|uniref:ATP-binding protein n=1 Tax=Brevundimonas sp. Leaf363 TaxID=1736353 RepID=UPI0006FFF0D6|nr:ATP-binding protein [Brevundimonas sp. Leaf363]KQS54002.1 hypothetical protein ASG17_13715 [Brevundimonas sp. Leaf363]
MSNPRRFGGLPILLQVAALAVLAVIASQAVAVAVLIFSPPPQPQGFSLTAARDALLGKPAQTTDGRALERRISDQPPPLREPDDPFAKMITAALADRLGVPTARVRISVEHRRGPGDWARRRPDERPGHRGPPPGRQGGAQADVQPSQDGRGRGGPPGPGFGPGGFDPFSDRLSFAPFVASLQLPDGRWATIEPPRDLLSPWQQRLLLTLLITLLLLAPLVWWFARRLTRPIRAFAAAAERLGADPEAPPLEPKGPAEVRTAITTFNTMQTALKDHMRQRSQTIAAIAHDLRTPLTRLRFRAEQAPEHVRDRMAADIEEMDTLIGQAMAYVKGQAAPERREALDLAVLAAECIDRFAETGADVVFSGHDPLPVLADPDALQRALDNLIGNALRYAGAARVVAHAEAGQALICVEDTGPGFPPEDLERVFDPFFRGERSRNRNTGGVGLGLAVARQAARAGGGDVVLTLPEGGGVVARLTLPLAT